MQRDGLTLRWEPARGPPRRVRFEPRSLDGLIERIEEEYTGCVWREVGRELVGDVAIELDDGEIALAGVE